MDWNQGRTRLVAVPSERVVCGILAGSSWPPARPRTQLA